MPMVEWSKLLETPKAVILELCECCCSKFQIKTILQVAIRSGYLEWSELQELRLHYGIGDSEWNSD